MARIRKSIFKQNLNSIPVLIEDTSQESVYFNIKQLNSYFTGGKNSFLITGTALLEPDTSILIEILDVNGNTIYVEAIKNFSEAGARLVVAEIYENTPRGPGIITIVGTARKLASGQNIPVDWENRTNLRWQKKIIIEPKIKNSTPIRMKAVPEIIVDELLLTGSTVTQTNISQSISNFSLKPKNILNKQAGYIVLNDCNTFQFDSSHLNAKITGSINLEKRRYEGTIPATTETYTVVSSHTASLDLPLSSLNASKSFTDVNITSSVDDSILNITPLSNGQYELVEGLYTSSNTTYVRTATFVTGSVQYFYVSESSNIQPSTILSFSKLRIINLDTLSGEIFRVKTSVKDAGAQTDFELVADTPVLVQELLITSSTGQNDKEVPIGKFTSNLDINSHWYAYEITGSSIPDPAYSNDSVSSSFYFGLSRTDANIFNAAYAVTTGSNYFIGTRQEYELFPVSEYTLKFDAYVADTSGSFSYTEKPLSMDVYLTGSSIVSKDLLGVKIASLTTAENVAYFPNKNFNFTVPRIGNAGLRFVIKNGFWQISNVSLKVAEEYAFSPSEATLVIPNNAKQNSSLIFKTALFDLNNNALDIDIVSAPSNFSGSVILSEGADVIGTVSSSQQILNYGIFATTGSNIFIGNQIISGSLTVSGSSTFTNIGPTILSGTLNVTQGITGSFKGDGSQLTSVTATLPTGTVSSSLQYPGWVTASSQIDYNSIQNKLSGVVSSSTQVKPLLPNGTVSQSAQYPGWVTASSQIDYNNIQNKLSGVYSSSAFTSPSQGTVRLSLNGNTLTDVDLGLQVTDTPTFAGIVSTTTASLTTTQFSGTVSGSGQYRIVVPVGTNLYATN